MRRRRVTLLFGAIYCEQRKQRTRGAKSISQQAIQLAAVQLTSKSKHAWDDEHEHKHKTKWQFHLAKEIFVNNITPCGIPITSKKVHYLLFSYGFWMFGDL